MSTVRLRRLHSDYQRLCAFIGRQPRLQLIQTEGNPPERYQLEYRVRSLRQKDGELHTVDSHLVEIALPRDYPRLPPQCRMLTPVFHPNIAPHAICIGDHWSAGESLPNLVARIGEMLAFQQYNVKSPLNGEAARWVEHNLERLPLDRVAMTPDDTPGSAAPGAAEGASGGPSGGVPLAGPAVALTVPPAPPPRPLAPPRPIPPPYPVPPSAAARPIPGAGAGAAPAPAHPVAFELACPRCTARLRLAKRPGPTDKVRCPRCQFVFAP